MNQFWVKEKQVWFGSYMIFIDESSNLGEKENLNT